MAHGQRDWSNIGADEVVHGLADDAELAARLGSVVTHNREGNVVFIETFEHGRSAWEDGLYGTGAEIIISAVKYRSSGYSAKLIAGSDSTMAVKLFRKFPLPVLGRYGLELSFLHHTNVDRIYWSLSYHDGTDEHAYICRYHRADDKIDIRDENGDYQDLITGADLDFAYRGFHTIKMVADLPNDEFVRLIVNETEHDLAGYQPYVFTESDGPNVRVDLLVYGVSGQNAFGYFDDIILTQNEPA